MQGTELKAAAESKGSTEFSSLWAGRGVALAQPRDTESVLTDMIEGVRNKLADHRFSVN